MDREQAALFESARGHGCRVLLSGFFGDQVLADTAYFFDLACNGRWLKLRHDLHAFSTWLGDVEPSELARDLRSQVVRRLPPRWLFRLGKRMVRRTRLRSRYPPWFTEPFCRRAEAQALARFDERRCGASAHAERYYRHTTAGHYVNFVRSDRAAAQAYDVDVRYPFRDRDLVEFLMAIPGDIVKWQGVPKGLLRRALADLLPAAVRERRSKADFTSLENDAARREAARVASMLTPNAASVRAGIVHPNDDALVAAYAGLDDAAGPLPGWRLADLLGLELWLQEYFDNRSMEEGEEVGATICE